MTNKNANTLLMDQPNIQGQIEDTQKLEFLSIVNGKGVFDILCYGG